MQDGAWSLQDAKNRFSVVVEASQRGEPQFVTKRGRPAVVVIAADAYARLKELETQAASSLVDHLLAIPQGGEDFDRLDLEPRKAAL